MEVDLIARTTKTSMFNKNNKIKINILLMALIKKFRIKEFKNKNLLLN